MGGSQGRRGPPSGTAPSCPRFPEYNLKMVRSQSCKMHAALQMVKMYDEWSAPMFTTSTNCSSLALMNKIPERANAKGEKYWKLRILPSLAASSSSSKNEISMILAKPPSIKT
ncbi:hypothetical protein PMKS-003807 [Pichia membranifaciens]|uniref:Uncharacterized protein n=1 Tax=Pichia membranifaciens TaxID=4926 RepID=A0A1Q2YL60_9ASCO|nr:hypothetical protein PMKS-003807 [Pichia membranifaciens]